MILTQALLEGTYAIQPVADEIFKKVIEPFIKGAKTNSLTLTKTVEITDYLIKAVDEKLESFDYPVFLTMKVMKTLKQEPGQITYLWSEIDRKKGGRILIFFRFPRNFINELSITQIKRKNISVLIHELIHAIDYNRRGKRVFSGKDTSKVMSPEDDYGYVLDDMEFNAIIHQIKKATSSNHKKWISIKNVSELIKFLSKEVYLIRDAFDAFNLEQSKNYTRFLLKRLYRENLLPPNFKGTLMR